MSSIFHIPRTLHAGNQPFPEDKLLNEAGVVVVLAEPGGGKSALLANLGRKFGAAVTRASCFFETGSAECLIIDALDEVARIGSYDITTLLMKVRATGADRVVLSCRSGEWEEAQTQLVKSVLGIEPVIVRLLSLSEPEQRVLFNHELPDDDFEAFAKQVYRFDLGSLLGNPEFLKLFAAAYIESGRVFTTRQAIFEDAVKYLGHEANPAIPQKGAPTRLQRIAWADEVFAKLLLSGAVGVSVAGQLDDKKFPNLGDLGITDAKLPSLLDTKLFKPASDAGQHEPVHRIVAEYCAARYLLQHIDNPANTFSIRQCLSIVAPNGVARNELRGLLGWLAALGTQAMQDAAIDIDPYAILGNGDPSLLSARSKQRILEGLQRLEANDPYFRRSDLWRSFSASGFFTADVLQTVSSILETRGGDEELRMLLLELLDGSPANETLVPTLRGLMLSNDVPEGIRVRAQMRLASVKDHDHKSDFDELIKAGDSHALRIAAELCMDIGPEQFEFDRILSLLRGNIQKLPKDFDRSYALKMVIRELTLATVKWLLDQFTHGLTCTCGANAAHECHCRDNVSKTVGALLDKYFELQPENHDPVQIWNWIKNLNYHNQKGSKDSVAVRALHEDHALRQCIQQHVMGSLTDRDEIWDVYLNVLGWSAHSGVGFWPNDQCAMTDIAFKADNVNLWAIFLSSHKYYNGPEKRGPDALRRHMRKQAKEKPSFMVVWAEKNRVWETHWQKARTQRSRSKNRWRRRDRKIAVRNRRSLHEDKLQIENGKYWGWLNLMAHHYLVEPDRLAGEFEGKIDVEKSLRNSITGQADHIPTLKQLGLHEKSQTARIFHAACLAEYRAVGHLRKVDRTILKVVKFDIGGYQAISKDEVARFKTEINHRLFITDGDREQYARDLIEPQLKLSQFADASLLDHEPEFQELRATLPLEWLTRFPLLGDNVVRSLFDMVAKYGDRPALCELICQRCSVLLQTYGPHPRQDPRTFWFLRYFYFVEEDTLGVWRWLSEDANMIFALEQHSGPRREGSETGWPELTARKVRKILEAFVEVWPKVPLPNGWGTGSPKAETAYRYLTNVIWAISRDHPATAIPVLDFLQADPRFSGFDSDLRSIRAFLMRKNAHLDSEPPNPETVVLLFDQGGVVNVEQMRILLLELFENLQKDIRGSDLDMLDFFYENNTHLMENASTKRIVTLLRSKLQALNFFDVIEHQLKDAKRCDFTVSTMVAGKRIMLPVEVKGQWNPELYSAAETQLFDQYSIHPNANQQGIYLVLWFGAEEKVAGRKNTLISCANDLQLKVEQSLPKELGGRIGVFVLDLSR